MADSIITPAMRSAVGVRGQTHLAEVERGAIIRFVHAIGDDNPAYPGVAPPTFLRTISPAIPPLPDANQVPRVLDGGSEWTYHIPIRPGDTISFTTTLESLAERTGRMGTMVIATYLTEYANHQGAVAATQRNTVIRLGPES